MIQQIGPYSACLSKKGIAEGKRCICSARLGLLGRTYRKKNMSLLCAALLLTLCVWRMCSELRLAFCWPFKFEIQSAVRARAHRGDGANFSSLYTLLHLLYSLLLSPPAAVVIPADLAFSPAFVPPPELQYRTLTLSVMETVVWLEMRRETVRICFGKEKDDQGAKETVKRFFLYLE